MGRKNSSVNNESKQYLTRKATVLVWATMRDLTALMSVQSNTTSEATVTERNMGRAFQPSMEM